MSSHYVKVNPVGKTVEVSEEESLFAQLKREGFNIKTTCGGCASCGECVVRIEEGENNLNEAGFVEKQLLGNVFHITKERLSCQTFVRGDITIDISNHIEKVEKPRIVTRVRKKADVEKMYETRKTEREEKLSNKPKRQGGNRRPKAFQFNDDEENKEN